MIGNQEGFDINANIWKPGSDGSHDFFTDFVSFANEFFNRILGDGGIDDFSHGRLDDGAFNVVSIPAINIANFLWI